MLSYFEYRSLKEAADSPTPPTGGPTPEPSPAGMPNPSTGLPPLGGASPAGDVSGMSVMGGMGAGGSDPMMGGMDNSMGVGAGDPSGGSSKALDLKYSNVWDAFEKLINVHKHALHSK